MIAYFSSKLCKQAKALFVATLLFICMLGTNWAGFSHSIAHSAISKVSINQSLATDLTPILSHSSEVCHLFDVLTLAGYLPTHSGISLTLTLVGRIAVEIPRTSFAAPLIAAYHSQAPPSLIL